MPDNTPLFTEDLISQRLQAQLPDGYTIRPLQRHDYARGHLEPLRDLTHVGDINEEQWLERFDMMTSCRGTYYTIVIVNDSREPGTQIVATGTLVVEKKLSVARFSAA